MSKYDYSSADQTQYSKSWIQWGLDALFNPITPFTKRQIQKSKPQGPESPLNSFPINHHKENDNNNDDTFYKRKQRQRQGGGLKSYSRDDILNDYYKQKELLPDAEDSYSLRRTASFSSTQSASAIPGKFPSPYHSSIPTSDLLSSSPPLNLLSSISKNVKLAARNAEKNKKVLDFNSSPVEIPNGVSSAFDYNREQKILKALDSNIDDLKQLTRDVEKFKVYKDRSETYNEQKNYKEKVDEYKKELQNELLKSKKLYDSYYEFVQKYKDIKQENQILKEKLKSVRLKNQKDESTLFTLKSTLQNTSTFEETLKRKIKYLEEKLEDFTASNKEEKFTLNEKIFLLEQKLKDESERHQLELLKRDQRIEELEEKLKAKRYSLSTRNSYSGTPAKERTYSKDDTMDFINRRFPDRVSSDPHYSGDY